MVPVTWGIGSGGTGLSSRACAWIGAAANSANERTNVAAPNALSRKTVLVQQRMPS